MVTFAGKLARISRGAFIWVVTLLFGLDVQGLYTLAWGIVFTLNTIGRFGVQRGVVRFVVEGRTAGDEERVEEAVAAALKITLVCSAAVAALTWLAAEWLATFYQKPIVAAVRIMAWSAPFTGVTWVFVSAIRALRIMRYGVYVMSIAGPLILLAGGVVAGLGDTGLEGVAWVQLAMTVGCCLLAVHYFRRFISLGNCLRRMRSGLPWRPMASFSLPVMGTDLLRSVLTQLDVLMLGFFVSGELVGIFVLVRRIASVMLKAKQAFDPIFSPIVSELSYQRRYEDLGQRFAVISRWILTINLPILAGILIVGDQILTLLAGDRLLTLPTADIAAAIKALFLLCIGMMIQGTFAVAESLLAMSGRPHLNFFNNILWLLTNFLLNLWFIKVYGFLGAAIGATLSMALVNGLRLLEVYWLYDIHPFHRPLGKPAAAGLGAAIGGWAMRELVSGVLWSIVASLGVFLALYALLLYLMGIEAEDRQLLKRLGQWLRRSP